MSELLVDKYPVDKLLMIFTPYSFGYTFLSKVEIYVNWLYLDNLNILNALIRNSLFRLKYIRIVLCASVHRPFVRSL